MDGALDLLEGPMPCDRHMIPRGPPVEKRRSKKLDADGWSLQAESRRASAKHVAGEAFHLALLG